MAEEREEGREPGRITVKKCQSRSSGRGRRGLGAVEGKGHSHPRRATRGAPVCTCPEPLPLAQPVCGERAPVSRVRFFVPAHARPHFDGSGSRPSSGQSTSAPCLAPPPRNLARTAPSFCPRGLGLPPRAAGEFRVLGLRISLRPEAGTSPLRLVRQAALRLSVPGLFFGATRSPALCWGRCRRRPPPSLPVGRFSW